MVFEFSVNLLSVSRCRRSRFGQGNGDCSVTLWSRSQFLSLQSPCRCLLSQSPHPASSGSPD